MSGYDVRFPEQLHEDRFYSVLKDNPDAKSIHDAIERLRKEPRPKGLAFEQIPPVDEAQFLITKFGIALKEDLPSTYLRALARCRITVGSYSILHDVMDDLKIIWLFQIIKVG